jgi:hypothetical protein
MGDGPRGGGACASSRIEATRHSPGKGQRASPGPAGVGERPRWAAPGGVLTSGPRLYYLRAANVRRISIGHSARQPLPRLLPHRKAWMSEDYRMAIFDAVGLALPAVRRLPSCMVVDPEPIFVDGTSHRLPGVQVEASYHGLSSCRLPAENCSAKLSYSPPFGPNRSPVSQDR